jgi:hypothetical protein
MDRIKAVCIVAELATAIASLVRWESIIASAGIAVLYSLLSRSRTRDRTNELLVFAREFEAACARKGLNSALKEKSTESNAPEGLREIERRLAAGDIEAREYKRSGDTNVDEFLDIIATGLGSGTDIRSNLGLFVSRLETEMHSKNKAIQSALNMDSLSTLGMAFFVPLFGGIGTSIIAASGSIIGSSTASLARSFQIIILLYITLMSYVMALFRECGRNEPALRAFQVALMGAAIMRTAAGFMIYAI